MYSSRRARELSALYGLSPPLHPSQLHPSTFFGSVGQSTVGLVDRSKAMESNLRGHMGRKLIGDENKLDRLSIVLDLLLPSNVLSRENMAVFIISPFFFLCAVRDNTLAQALSLSLSLSLSLPLSLARSLSHIYQATLQASLSGTLPPNYAVTGDANKSAHLTWCICLPKSTLSVFHCHPKVCFFFFFCCLFFTRKVRVRSETDSAEART